MHAITRQSLRETRWEHAKFFAQLLVASVVVCFMILFSSSLLGLSLRCTPMECISDVDGIKVYRLYDHGEAVYIASKDGSIAISK